jgi:hypothetical protein
MKREASKLALCFLFLFAAELKAGIPWSLAVKVRPDYTTGYGPVIDDLEQHVDGEHPMRNEKDPGNWAHELSHWVHSVLRKETKERDNCFYVGEGKYLRLPEPSTTLKQIAEEIPKDERGASYNLYFVEQRSDWNDVPLYVLDEACCYTTGLQYHVTSKTKDKRREEAAEEFVLYSQALVRAVEKHDPGYSHLDVLKDFVDWNARRVATLLGKETPEIPDYILY